MRGSGVTSDSIESLCALLSEGHLQRLQHVKRDMLPAGGEPGNWFDQSQQDLG